MFEFLSIIATLLQELGEVSLYLLVPTVQKLCKLLHYLRDLLNRIEWLQSDTFVIDNFANHRAVGMAFAPEDVSSAL